MRKWPFLTVVASVLLMHGTSNAQNNPLTPALNGSITAPSPNAAALGSYGQVPISLSTGQLAYNIPICELDNHDIKIPVSLSYNYQGFKPNEHPSWTGLGWTLNAGGVITRVKHGEPDEIQVLAQSGGGCFGGTSYKENVAARSDLSSLNPTTNLGNAGSTINSLLKRQRLLVMNCQAGPGVPLDYFDSEPDEFIFNFAGYTGKFVWDNASNNFVILTNSSEIFDIQVDYAQGFEYSTTIKLPNYISGFTITTYDGYKYKFGGDFTNDHNIEFFLGPPSGHYLGSGGSTTDKGNCMYSSSWYLAKITSPTGIVANFIYEDGGIAATIEPSFEIGSYPATSSGYTRKKSNFNTYSIPINTTSYLSEINSGTKKVTFSRESTYHFWHAGNSHDYYEQQEEMPDYPKILGTTIANNTISILAQYKNMYPVSLFPPDPDLFVTVRNDWQKLTSVALSESNNVVDAFKFDYNKSRNYDPNHGTELFTWGASATGRLELAAITRTGTNSNLTYPSYQFDYYGVPSPTPTSDPYTNYKYGSRKIDHWGFFNVTDYFGFITDTSNVTPDAGTGGLYRNSRNPIATGNTLGALKMIHYPTGGNY